MKTHDHICTCLFWFLSQTIPTRFCSLFGTDVLVLFFVKICIDIIGFLAVLYLNPRSIYSMYKTKVLVSYILFAVFLM